MRSVAVEEVPHLGHAQSLHEITGGLAASEGKLRHLGVADPPKRSTLSYANEHRPWQLYETVFYNLLKRCQAEAKAHKRSFRFKHKLLSLDSIVIPLCLSVFDWAQYTRAKGRSSCICCWTTMAICQATNVR